MTRGVVVVYNKREGAFSTEDESMLMMAGRHLGIVYRLSEKIEEHENNKMRSKGIVDAGIECLTRGSLWELTKCVERYIKDLMYVDNVRMLVISRDSKMFVRHLGQDEEEVFLIGKGIVSKCYYSSMRDISIDPLSDVDYSNKIDIDTRLPVITIPVSSLDRDEVVCVLQYHHPYSILYNEYHNRCFYELYMIDNLINIIKYCLQRLMS